MPWGRASREAKAVEAMEMAAATRAAAAMRRDAEDYRARNVPAEVKKRYESWASQVPAPGELTEDGVERALTQLKLVDGGDVVDEIRPKSLRLARKWAKPGEVVLAIHHKPRYPRDPEELIIALSRGYSVAAAGGGYRVDFDPNRHRLDVPEASRIRLARSPFGLRREFGSRAFNVHSEWFLFASVYQSEVADGTRGAPAPTPGSRGTGRRRGGQRPATRLIRTARDAELAAAEWMTYLGYRAVAPTPVGADAGVDIHASTALAQVKAETKPTGRPTIQQHHGVCTAANKDALFFSLAGYTPAAAKFADQIGMALFRFNLAAEVIPVNHSAHEVFDRAHVAPPPSE